MPCWTTVQAPSFATTKPCRYNSKPSCTSALSTLATRRLVRASAAPSTPVRSPNCISSAGVLREWRPRPPQTVIPRTCSRPASPRLSAPSTLVVMPLECQSIPITHPRAWNQNGCANRRRTPCGPSSRTRASTITAPRRAIRDASQSGTRPPCRGRSALPVRPIRAFSISAAQTARASEPHQWTRLGLAEGVRADAVQPARRALRSGPDRFEEGLHPVDDLEILGAEPELEVALSFAPRAQSGPGEVGAPDVGPGVVDEHGLEMHARAHLQRQPSRRQAPPLLERSAERPRGQLRVEDAQLHAPPGQLREEGEHGSESAFALDLHVLQVRSGDQHGFARMRELFADHFAVQIASLQQRRGDGAHDAAMPRRGSRATLLIAGVRRGADSVLRRPGVAGVAGIAAP